MVALLSRKEAAAKLGVSLITLDKARESGHLAYIQHCPGGKVWITEDAIDDFLMRATHQARPAIRVATNGTYRRRRA